MPYHSILNLIVLKNSGDEELDNFVLHNFGLKVKENDEKLEGFFHIQDRAGVSFVFSKGVGDG